MIGLKFQVAGYIRIVARSPEGKERVLADWFPNLITDFGLNNMASLSLNGYVQFCRVGSGSTTPAVTDTTLVSQIASSNTIQSTTFSAASSAPYYGAATRTYRFATGVAAGNLSEVGFGQTSTGSNLFSRALILDGGGSPTTITVLSSETLDVVYQLRIYSPTTDVTGSISIASVSYDYTIRASQANTTNWSPSTATPTVTNAAAFTGAIGAVTGSPSGTTSAATSSSLAAYSNNSLTHVFTYTWGLNAGNIGGVKSVTFGMVQFGIYQIEFSSVIPKDNTKTMTLTFSLTWARHTI